MEFPERFLEVLENNGMEYRFAGDRLISECASFHNRYHLSAKSQHDGIALRLDSGFAPDAESLCFLAGNAISPIPVLSAQRRLADCAGRNTIQCRRSVGICSGHCGTTAHRRICRSCACMCKVVSQYSGGNRDAELSADGTNERSCLRLVSVGRKRLP